MNNLITAIVISLAVGGGTYVLTQNDAAVIISSASSAKIAYDADQSVLNDTLNSVLDTKVGN